MRPILRAAGVGLMLGGWLYVHPTPAVAQADRAEDHFRVARRLAAEGSPQAAEALRKVVELDPEGALADDALFELALLEHPPSSPWELGRMDTDAAASARAILEELLSSLPRGDRAPEARLRLALVLLEPTPSRDLERARVELLSLATSREHPGDLRARARATLAWLDAASGRVERAARGAHRLRVDAAGHPWEAMFRRLAAQTWLRAGRVDRAAQALAEAERRSGEEAAFASDLRGAILRRVRHSIAQEPAFRPRDRRRVRIAYPGVRAFAPSAAGGWWVVLGREDRVLRIDADGRGVAEWRLTGAAAVTEDAFGRALAAAGSSVYRLEAKGRVHMLAAIPQAGAISTLAADALGRVLVLDRKGERAFLWGPEEGVRELGLESLNARIDEVAWDGVSFWAASGRSGILARLGRPNQRVPVEGLVRPRSLDADSGGWLAVLDGRNEEIRVLSHAGETVQRISLEALEVDKPLGVRFGAGGSLHVYDGRDGAMVVVP